MTSANRPNSPANTPKSPRNCAKIDGWLEETGAKLPQKNTNYDAGLAARQQEEVRTKDLQACEKQHTDFLSPDFQPNKDWWGAILPPEPSIETTQVPRRRR